MVERAPVFTTPGYTPSGAGLPEYMPGPPEPAVERSPYKRHLPQTPETRREAGLWSAEAPTASSGTPPALEVGGVRLPMLVTGRSEDTLPVALCHRLMTSRHFLKSYAHDYALGGQFTEEQRACIVARWLQSCLWWSTGRFKSTSLPRPNTDHLVKMAGAFADEKCSKELEASKSGDGRTRVDDAGVVPTYEWESVVTKVTTDNRP